MLEEFFNEYNLETYALHSATWGGGGGGETDLLATYSIEVLPLPAGV